MTAVDAPRTSFPAHDPRTVSLTFGPASDLSHLLRTAADVLDASGVVPTAIEPSRGAGGAWVRITCDVDPADVAALIALPALADHRIDHGPQRSPGRCPACELREYLTD
jgi:hypothetical protein